MRGFSRDKEVHKIMSYPDRKDVSFFRPKIQLKICNRYIDLSIAILRIILLAARGSFASLSYKKIKICEYH